LHPRQGDAAEVAILEWTDLAGGEPAPEKAAESKSEEKK
jgi:hypothetical protein